MHTRRLAMLILGCFLGLTAAMMLVATHNFRGVDELLAAPAPEAKQMLSKLEPEQQRMLLRYQASELNRFYFTWYLNVQIIVGLLLAMNIATAVKGSKLTLVFVGFLILLTILERAILLPEIEYLGRAIDFVPPNATTPARTRFWSFHHIFSGVEIGKLLAVMVIGAKMLVRSDTRRRSSSLTEEALEEIR